ncbi:MAG: hypothetical protein ACRCWR_04095 [Saezia sp.]
MDGEDNKTFARSLSERIKAITGTIKRSRKQQIKTPCNRDFTPELKLIEKMFVDAGVYSLPLPAMVQSDLPLRSHLRSMGFNIVAPRRIPCDTCNGTMLHRDGRYICDTVIKGLLCGAEVNRKLKVLTIPKGRERFRNSKSKTVKAGEAEAGE